MHEKLQGRERKRSKSILRRNNHELKRCSWNFPFKLEFKERTYELYAPTRGDRDQWILMLGTIAEMNSQGVKLESTTPFEYLAEQEEKKKRLLEESKMTESARIRASEFEIDKQIFEQVHLWLRLNEDQMRQHRPEVIPYISDDLHVNIDGAKGVAYLITRANQSIVSTQGL